MFADSFLGILLHAGINGGVYAQTIVIEVVGCAIGFVVLIAEAVERILLPLAFVYLILLHVPL